MILGEISASKLNVRGFFSFHKIFEQSAKQELHFQVDSMADFHSDKKRV